MENYSVTVTLSNNNHYVQDSIIHKGEEIILGRNMWWLSRQKIQNKFFVARLMKKKYTPKVIVTKQEDAERFTIKPLNF